MSALTINHSLIQKENAPSQQLFPEEPSLLATRRKIAIGVRIALQELGARFFLFGRISITIYKASYQDWAEYRRKIAEIAHQDMLPYQLEAEGKTEEEQEEIMWKMSSDFAKKYGLRFPFTKDRLNLNTEVKNMSASDKTITFTWPQLITALVTALIFGIGCVSWWTFRLDRVEDKVEARITSLETNIKSDISSVNSNIASLESFMREQAVTTARIEERSKTPTSTHNHSSTQPKATGGSPEP